jgi:4-diphosphocytidyl-2-C-methyl-D-erythritol kinase
MARSRSPHAIRVRAFAKLNLTLRVLGTRADGYHDVRTIFQSLVLHDTLTVTPTRGEFTIECDDPCCPQDASNLVWAAAERLWRETGRRGPLSRTRVRIRKRIPMQAGLGGGSSDAAAALRALAQLWRARCSDEDLRAIARGLGADVPYFFEGGTVLGVERGDLVFPLLDWAPSWAVLALPDFGVSTKDAYEWWDSSSGNGRAASPRPRTDLKSLAFSLPQHELCNDLEPPVTAHHPEIGRVVGALRRAGATHAAMSGSGSAVFGLFSMERRARAAAGVLATPHLRAVVAQTLDRRRYRRLSALRST